VSTIYDQDCSITETTIHFYIEGGWTVAVNIDLQSTTFPVVSATNKWRDLISKYSIKNYFNRPWTGTFREGKQLTDFEQIHFYCYKKTVGRVVSIVTKNNTAGHKVLEYFLNDTYAGSEFPDACGSFDRLPDDSSMLAQTCSQWGSTLGKWGHRNAVGKLRLTGRPFGHDKDYVFAFYAQTSTFACDDPFVSNMFSIGDKLRISFR